MKKPLSLILLLAMTSPAFSQGKLGFFNDPTRLIYFTPNLTSFPGERKAL